MNEPPKLDRQREHQANERTFLAWLRTSMSLIAFGFAIARFGLFVRQLELALNSEPPATTTFLDSERLGVALVIVGVMTVALGAWRYNRVFWQIERSSYRPNRLMIWLTTAIVMTLGLLSLPLLLRPIPYQPPLHKPSGRFNPLE